MKLPVTFARIINLLFVLALSSWAHAAPVTYTIDPQHTYPSFESSHMGISTWRGKFDKSSGTVTLDRDSGDGKVDIIVDLKSVDFGNKLLNQTMAGPEFFNTAKFPRATYKGRLTGFVDGAPSSVVGELTLHGVSKPLVLKINSFTCVLNQMIKPERCGADAFATFNRDDWNLDAGKSYGFPMQVVLRIQVEAVKDELPE